MSADSLSPVKRALLEIQELKAKLRAAEKSNKEPIAIVGAGLRFPGAVNDLDSYWQLLANGVDAITEIPRDRWDIEDFYDPDPETPGKMYTRKGGFLSDIDKFDAHFFGISPREAVSMDPQQRLLLQVAWEGLENAGQAPDQLNGTQTGVFIGISNNDYARLLFSDFQDIDLHYATGNSYSVVPGRLSYLLGLRGPSIAIDTACSSSLTAIHLACQSLRSGESDMALAGGVNLILTPEMNINFCNARMMAFDDKCKTFDAAADGYVRGEGCAIVVLKRLSDAAADHDHILAVIRGSAVNQDGRSSGLTAPNGPSQEAVMRSALTNADVSPEQVSYLEAHGTGTSLGDPIEVQALAAVLGPGRSMDNPLMIGSVKTNFGHLESAAGIAGLLKVVLALRHREIPPHLHLQKLNPYVPWQKLPVTVPTKNTPWTHNGAPRVGSVSSFGFSGTNAHVVLQEASEEYPDSSIAQGATTERSVQLLTLSAKRIESLNSLAARYDAFLSQEHIDFGDFCFASTVGRAHLPYRSVVLARHASDAREKLGAFVAGKESPHVIRGTAANADVPEISFLFTGHGSQYVEMGRQLYETHPTFRVDMDECSKLLEAYLDKPLLSVLYPSPDPSDPSAANLMNTMTYAQPALFALEYALAKLWRSWGIEPTFVMGHSVGEYAAACIAGVFSLAGGLKLVAARARLMDSLPQAGKMVTVFAEEERVAREIAPYAHQVSIGAINGPTHTVISGADESIDAIVAKLESDGIQFRRLEIAQAAHSPSLDPILDEFEEIAKQIDFSAPQIGLISAMTGQLVTSEDITNARYWRRHLRETVQFAAGLNTLLNENQRAFLEIGPQPTLVGMGRRNLTEQEDTGLWLPSLRKGHEDWQQMLESLATLYVNGVNVDWKEYERPYPRRRIPIPTYPWAEESYWRAPSKAGSAGEPKTSGSLWETALASGRKQEGQAPLDFAMHTYQAKWDVLDRLTIAYILRSLHDLNLFTTPDETHTLETILAKTQIAGRYRGLLKRWLNRLVAKGLLIQEGDRFTSLKPLTTSALETLRTEAGAILADTLPVAEYVERCGAKLISVLTGKENPLETLFPEGSYATVSFLYNGWPLIQYFNGILRTLIETFVRHSTSQAKVRILEVGAGTGGSTAAILPSLPANRTEYQFTDLSDFFLARAQENFKEYPFINYGVLNIERDPESQGYPAQSYDLVIAANALHATQNLEETLANVRKLLAPGGLLLLLEGTNYLSWFDITTSLIEGWERFDDGIRGDVPLLSPTKWQQVLQANGFEKAAVFPEDLSLAALLAHNVIAAQLPKAASAMEPQGTMPENSRSQIASRAGATSDIANTALLEQLAVALPEDRRELLVSYVREQVAGILRLDSTAAVGRKDRLMDLGLDSLMAVELRSRLNKGLNPRRNFSATLMFDYPTIEAIANYLENEMFAAERRGTQAGSVAGAEHSRDKENQILSMSDEEIESLLLKKFGDEK